MESLTSCKVKANSHPSSYLIYLYKSGMSVGPLKFVLKLVAFIKWSKPNPTTYTPPLHPSPRKEKK